MHLKKKDKVLILSGKDKGKKGEVLKLIPEKNQVIVSKVNFIKKHSRPNPKTGGGGIIQQEAPLNISKVMLLCTKCNQSTRIKIDTLSDGKKVRMCKKCGEILV
ncbi:MAG: 50S ribosomal protein L24 [Elusimicrobia bacterium]|nr:50S ribosomal protein L24 [Elusimicrobiota bacterium]